MVTSFRNAQVYILVLFEIYERKFCRTKVEKMVGQERESRKKQPQTMVESTQKST